MKRLTIIAGAAATAALAGTLLAVPALADNNSTSAAKSTTSTKPLTAAEKQAVDGFLAGHPQLAHGLAARAAAWDTFMKAHPDIAAEIAKVKALPTEQRRAEMKKWLADHPDSRTAIRDWRGDLRNQRQDRRQDRRDQRQDRRQDRTSGTASTTSLSG